VRARALALASLVLLACATTACGSEKTRVYVFGDSLVFQASPYLADQLRHDGFSARIASISGGATCDLFAKMKSAHDRFHPAVVAISFSGNAFGACMRHPDGSALSDAERLAKYRTDTEFAISLFGKATLIYLVGTPVNQAGDDGVFQIYRAIAPRHPNVSFVDGGKYVTPHHQFAHALACLSHERCTGPVVNNIRTNIVRSPDDAHFCPIAAAFGKPCPVYSSGAYRFALAITEAIDRGTK
jgi:hypothetical protein